MRVCLIDANALIYRIYHALPRLEDLQGRPIQAVYGLANMLLKFLSQEKFDYIFALYDRPEPTVRHQVFKEYKATRPPVADDLKIQISLSQKIFLAFNIPIIEKVGYEADDLIATLKEKFTSLANEIIILSGDLDTLQLVDEKTKVLTMKKGITQTEIYTPAKVKERFGILPNQIPDYKALVGDASDNIPGIPGIGPKTASGLLNKYLNLVGIIKAAQEKKINLDLAKKIIDNKEKILFHRDLVILRKNLEIDEKLLQAYSGFKNEDLILVFKEFGFKSLIQRLKPTIFTFVPAKKEKEGDIYEINSPFFFLVDKDKIKIVDGSEEIKILTKDKLKDLINLPWSKFTYDLKNIFKELFVSDFYFDKKIDLNKIYDLKIIFWLLHPEKSKPSLETIISYFNPEAQEKLSSAFSVSQILVQKLKEEKLSSLYFEIELPLIPILARAELRGLKINLQALKNFEEKLKEQNKEILKVIFELAGEKFNPNSPLQLRKILFEKLKIKTKGLSKTSKGEISTQEADLLKIIHLHPIIEKIISYRKINKFLTTYTSSLLKAYNPQTQRIYTLFEQTGSATGRIISENPNLQNLPLTGDLARTLRKVFVSQENFIFLSGDYSQLELRLLAHLSQDENLISAFLQNIDIHSQTAKTLFGDDSPENRRKAKIINFGIVYGITPRGLAERLLIPVSQATKLIEKFFYFYPQVKKFREDLINFAQTYSYVETLFGRKRFIPEIASQSYRERKAAERIVFNMPIQGLGADLLKKALIEIDKEIFKKNLGDKVFFILPIHDEIIFEIREEIKKEFRSIIKEKMQNVYRLNVPLEVKIKEGKNLEELQP